MKVEEENNTEFTTDAFGNKKFGNLKSFTESKSYQQSMSKEFQEISLKEKTRILPKMNSKPVKNREA